MKKQIVSRAEFNLSSLKKKDTHAACEHHYKDSHEICEPSRYWAQPARAKYLETYGCYFNAKTAAYAVSKLENRDKSDHTWTCEQVVAALKPLGVVLTPKNKHNAHYLANMLYSDYFDGATFTEAHILKMVAYKMGDIDAKPTDIYTMWEAKMMNHCEYIVYASMI